MHLIPLSDIAPATIDSVLDAAFGHDRRQRTAYAVRRGMAAIATYCFAMRDGDAVTGTIQCWPVAIFDDGGRTHPMVMVGPVAVLPERQRTGIGQVLMDTAIHAIDNNASPTPPQVMIGDEEYYGRWGFHAEPDRDWALPGPFDPARLLIRNPCGTTLPDRGRLGARMPATPPA